MYNLMPNKCEWYIPEKCAPLGLSLPYTKIEWLGWY